MHQQEATIAVTDEVDSLKKATKFKKIDGKPCTFGAHRANISLDWAAYECVLCVCGGIVFCVLGMGVAGSLAICIMKPYL